MYRSRLDWTGHDWSKQDRTGHERSLHGKDRYTIVHDRTRHDWNGQYRTGYDMSRQDLISGIKTNP